MCSLTIRGKIKEIRDFTPIEQSSFLKILLILLIRVGRRVMGI